MGNLALLNREIFPTEGLPGKAWVYRLFERIVNFYSIEVFYHQVE